MPGFDEQQGALEIRVISSGTGLVRHQTSGILYRGYILANTILTPYTGSMSFYQA